MIQQNSYLSENSAIKSSLTLISIMLTPECVSGSSSLLCLFISLHHE